MAIVGWAMLFIDFDLSRQGDQLYVANGYNSPRKDIEVGRNYKKILWSLVNETGEKMVRYFSKVFSNALTGMNHRQVRTTDGGNSFRSDIRFADDGVPQAQPLVVTIFLRWDYQKER
jgi:hypothetical protein